jgi:hypothetical protein
MPYNFCFIKFLPSQTVEAEHAGHTLFRGFSAQGVRVWGCNPSTNLSCIEDNPHAKFHCDQPSGLDFHSRYTCTHTHTHAHTQAHTQAYFYIRLFTFLTKQANLIRSSTAQSLFWAVLTQILSRFFFASENKLERFCGAKRFRQIWQDLE